MRQRLGSLAVLASACGLAACAGGFVYAPNPPLAAEGPAKYKAAVGFAGEDAAGCGVLGDDLTSKQLTDVFVRDLGASALFTVVEYEGAGQDDVVVRPALKACSVKEVPAAGRRKKPVRTVSVDFEVSARKGDDVWLTKVYHRDWDAEASASGKKLSAAMQDVMRDVRSDLAASLK